jgi:hypothetical protein
MNITLAGSAIDYNPSDDQLSRTSVELAAFDGEVGNGVLPMPTDDGSLVVAGGRQAMFEEGSTLISDGFLVDQDRGKGFQPAGPSLEIGYGLQDANALLDGFRISRRRGSETDVARVLAFAAADGPSWDTTWVIDDNTVTMPAKRYYSDGGWTTELIPDVVAFTGKTLFLHDKAAGGRCLHYHLLTEGHVCGLALSDVIADYLHSAITLEPKSPQRTRTSIDLRNDIKGVDQAGRTSIVTDATSIAAHDADGLQHQAQVDIDATSQSDLDVQTAAFLASQKDELDTWTCTIGPLDEDALALIRVGDLITVTSYVMGLTAATKRIAHMTLAPMIGENSRARTQWWMAVLELGAPIRRRARMKSRQPLPYTTPFICEPTDYTVKSFANSDVMACVFPAHLPSQACESDPGVSNSDAMLVYDGATYRIDYLVYHAPASNQLTAFLAYVGGAYIGTSGPGVGNGTETGIYMGDLGRGCEFGPPDDIPAASTEWTVPISGAGSQYVTAALVEASCTSGDSYASSISAHITYLSGPDPRFSDLLPCTNGEPANGQEVRDPAAVGDGTTTSFTTGFPYAAGSLRIIVNGLDWTNVPNVVTETDPATGAYDLVYPFPLGSTVLVIYDAAI